MTNPPQKLTYQTIKIIALSFILEGFIFLGVLWFLFSKNHYIPVLLNSPYHTIAAIGACIFCIISSIIIHSIISSRQRKKTIQSAHEYYSQYVVLYAVDCTGYIFCLILSLIFGFSYINLVPFALALFLLLKFFPKEMQEEELNTLHS